MGMRPAPKADSYVAVRNTRGGARVLGDTLRTVIPGNSTVRVAASLSSTCERVGLQTLPDDEKFPLAQCLYSGKGQIGAHHGKVPEAKPKSAMPYVAPKAEEPEPEPEPDPEPPKKRGPGRPRKYPRPDES